jgi:hypothetical protein
MKNFKLQLLIVASFLLTLQLYSQKKIVTNSIITEDLITVYYQEKDNKDSTKTVNKIAYKYKKIEGATDLKLAIKNNYFFDKHFSVDRKKKKVKASNRNFNNAMLNILFAQEVSSYIGESKDLSLKKSYAVISTADKSLFLGGSFIGKRKKDTEKLTHIFTVGLKAKLNEAFVSFLNQENGNLENEIGLNFKYTWINEGTISYYKNKKDETRNLTELVLIPKYEKKVVKGIDDSEYQNELDEHNAIYNKVRSTDKEISAYYTKKYEELYLELANEELERLKKEQLYTFIKDSYFTAEVFAPVSRTFYSVVPAINASLASNNIGEKAFYPWKINTGYTWFRKYLKKGKTFYFSAFASVFNNNNITTSVLKSRTFNILNGNNPNIVNSTTTFYEGDYNRFTIGSISAEFVSYFIKKGAFGISAAAEQNIGNHYNPLNWKLGIPVSLKDKEGKPTVNFELQLREVDGDRFLGVGVGFAFGKFIK